VLIEKRAQRTVRAHLRAPVDEMILRITSTKGRANVHRCAEALFAAIHGSTILGSGNF